MKVIIDAANVAHFQKEEGSKAKLKNITLAVKALEEENHDFLIIADASLRHNIDDKETFVKLVEDGIIDEVPVGTIADHYILDLAYDEDAKVLSNDKFRDFMSEFPDINSIRIPFAIKDNKLIMGKAKKPKKVKNLLQNICDEILNDLDRKRWVVYKGKETTKFTPLNVAKQSILLLDESEQDNVSTKIEGIFSRLPMFDKVMEMVDDVETSVPYVIFVLVHPKDYKAAVKDAGNISVTVADRLRLVHKPLIAVRNDLFIKPGYFGLNIVLTDEVEDNPPYNIEIQTNTYDEVFIKKNSRNIASTIAGRLGSWKFPFVSVKPNMLLERPGEFEIYLEKNSKKKKDKDKDKDKDRIKIKNKDKAKDKDIKENKKKDKDSNKDKKSKVKDSNKDKDNSEDEDGGKESIKDKLNFFSN